MSRKFKIVHKKLRSSAERGRKHAVYKSRFREKVKDSIKVYSRKRKVKMEE